MKNKNNFAGRLRALRIRRGWTQKELASQATVTPAAINQIERGKRYPSLVTLLKITKFLGVSIDCLLDDTNQQTEKEKALDEKVKRAIERAREVDALDLRGFGLTKLTSEIASLKNIVVLDISENKLTEIPSWIGELKNLLCIDIIDNKITSLPKEIEGLKKLRSLDLNLNPISLDERERIKKLLPRVNIYFYWRDRLGN